MWHLTHDTRHLTVSHRKVNIVSKFQVPSSYGLQVIYIFLITFFYKRRMVHKGSWMFSQNVRSIAYTQGLFKTLNIIHIYLEHWANIQIYSKVYIFKKNINEYLFEHQSIRIFEYSKSLFMLIPNEFLMKSLFMLIPNEFITYDPSRSQLSTFIWATILWPTETSATLSMHF